MHGLVRTTCALLASFSAAGAQQRWTVSAIPTVDIHATSANGDIQFEYAAGATRLPSGEILVADGAAGVLRIFDKTGRPNRTVGRRGTGPGEFQYVSWIGQCGGDSVVVWDFMQRRLALLDPTGRVARQMPPIVGIIPFTLACSRDGRTLAVHGWSAQPRPDGGPIYRGTGPLVLLDRNGAPTLTLDTLPSGEMAVIGGGAGPRPLGKYTYIAASRTALYVATGDSATLLVYAPNGTPGHPIRTPVERRTPTSRQVALAVEAGIAYGPKPLRDRLRPLMAALAPPDELPPFSGLFVDPLDVVWVILSFPGEGATRLRALDQNGRVLGDVSIAADLTILEVGVDYLLARLEDRDGELSVRQYELRRGATPRP